MRNKKYIQPTALALVLLLSTCGSMDGTESRVGESQTKSVNEVLASRQQAAESQKAASASLETVDVIAAGCVVEKSSGASIDLEGADGTDPDLMKLDVTMVLSEVYNIMVNPDSCMGEIIQMRGFIAIYRDETKGTGYYFCIVQDVTVCCAQGIEFKLADSYRFPDDYPLEGSEIIVHGRFNVYREGGYKYAVSKNMVLKKVSTENEGETTAP